MKRALLMGLVAALSWMPPAQAAPVLCPDNGHYYEVVPQLETWVDADSIAGTMSHLGTPGHLVTLTSSLEQAWFESFLQSESPTEHVHIGGVQDPAGAEPGGGWGWTTGEPLVYTNWYPGEPNQYRNNSEDHMFAFRGSETYRGQWADGTGTTPRWFVVEYDVEPPLPVTLSSWGRIKTSPE